MPSLTMILFTGRLSNYAASVSGKNHQTWPCSHCHTYYPWLARGARVASISLPINAVMMPGLALECWDRITVTIAAIVNWARCFTGFGTRATEFALQGFNLESRERMHARAHDVKIITLLDDMQPWSLNTMSLHELSLEARWYIRRH